MPTDRTPGSAVSLRGVSKSFSNHVALQPTDLEIRDGEFLCLLGPSGCGKTTLLSLIGGFLRPSSGTIFMSDQRVDQLPPNRRDINTVFQSYALFPHMTVAANVAFGLKMAKTPKTEIPARVGEALDMVGLAHLGERLPSALSGGQQQRVALARALVRRPSVLALDEPFGALDLNLRKRLQLELKNLHRELGITFVFVTHDQDEAMVLSDRVAIMSEGRIEQLAPPAEVYLRPHNRFVAEFVGESNIFDLDRHAGGVDLVSFGRLPDALVPAELTAGRAQVMVRPEFVDLHTEPGHGRLEVEIIDRHFLGEALRVDLTLTGSQVPLVAKLSGAAGASLHASDRRTFYASWDPDRAAVLATSSH
jgi:spermidine/putrescine transport system ATP-binding protein